MTNPKLVLTPRRAAVLAGSRSTADVLVRLQAPPMPQGELATRGPLHLALVIDRSGSMSGQPLAEAKRCADFVVDGLRPSDQVAILSYDDEVRCDCAFTAASNRETLHRAIAQIHEGGCTNLHGGWLAGAEQLAPHTRADGVSRVILLSDGKANRGVTDSATIFAQCGKLASAGVTTSTYGLGHHFNEELMVGMARAGQGNSYYGQTAEDLHDPFVEELALLDALCARDVELEVSCAQGVTAEVVNGYPAMSAGRWRLPDLAHDGEAWALLRLTIDATATVGGEWVELITVGASWRGVDGQAGSAAPCTLALPAMPAAAYAALAEDELVVRRAKELEMAGLQDEARQAARREDWVAVEATLAAARRAAYNHPWLEDSLAELRELASRKDAAMLAKEAHYGAARMRTRLSALDEDLQVVASASAPYLRRKAAQGKAEPPDRKG